MMELLLKSMQILYFSKCQKKKENSKKSRKNELLTKTDENSEIPPKRK